MKIRAIIVSILVGLLVTTITSCAKEQAKEKQELQKIVVAESARGEHWLPVYLAYELGYFKNEGLDIEFVTYQGGPLAIPALLAGDAQFCLTGYEQVLKTDEKGKKTKMIVATTNKHPWSLLVRPEIKTFADLKGKKINGGKPGSSGRAFVRACLLAGGLNPNKDVIYVDIPTSGIIGAFEKKEIDADFAGSLRKIELLKRGAHTLVDINDPEQHKKVIGSDTYHLYVVQTTDEYIQKHPDIIQKFVNATVRGIKWQNEHTPEEIASTIAPLFSGTNKGTMAEVISDVMLSISPDGYFTREGHDAAVKLSLDVGMITKPVPFEDVVDQSFIKKAYQEIKK